MYNPMISKAELEKHSVFESYAKSLREREREEVPFLEFLLCPTLHVSAQLRAFFYFGELKAITRVLRTVGILKKKHVVKDRKEALQHYLALGAFISEAARQSALDVSDSMKIPEDMEELLYGSFMCTFIEHLNLTLYKTVIMEILDYEPPINYQFN